jgi:hypothetical protein
MLVTTKVKAGEIPDKQVFNAAGMLLEFLASPDEVGDALCCVKRAVQATSPVQSARQKTTVKTHELRRRALGLSNTQPSSRGVMMVARTLARVTLTRKF